jgi:hypothetical protein
MTVPFGSCMLSSCDVFTNFHDAIRDEEFDVRFIAPCYKYILWHTSG